jgi:hypothetical protein
MPNHCENDLYITGEDELLDALEKAVVWEGWEDECGDEEKNYCKSEFSFRQIVPMSESLLISNGTYAELSRLLVKDPNRELVRWCNYPWAKKKNLQTAADLLVHFGYTDLEAAWVLGRQQLDNLENYGHATAIDWRLKNWGTKWDAYFIQKERRPGRLTYHFQTAWSPPLPVVAQLGRAFPSLAFELLYFERGCAFQGELKLAEGVTVGHVEQEYHGDRGG